MTFRPNDCTIECDNCKNTAETRVNVYCTKCFMDLVKENKKLKSALNKIIGEKNE
jgi:hypothetical protein